MTRLFAALAPALALAAAPLPALASVCQSVAGILPDATHVRLASADLEGEVTIRFIGHATYLIETGGGVSIATDYTGWSGPVEAPTVVTMNNAHETHWTPFPDERIPHALKGWTNEAGDGPADHWLEVGDALVRNVPTDVRSRGGGARENGNSIFVFEVGDLCIGHLGHLHHTLGPDHYAAIGRLDVVMAPVDGGLTLDLPTMIRLLKKMRASVVIPMHWFGRGNLEAFVAGMADDFAIDRADDPFIEVSLRSLPDRPTVVVLEPSYLREDGD